MKKHILLLLFLTKSTTTLAEPFRDCFRYGTYGLVAGALAGGTSMALSEDPGSHMTPVARGASLGLYAGLIVAIVNNMGDYKEPKYEIQPVSLSQQTFGLAFLTRF